MTGEASPIDGPGLLARWLEPSSARVLRAAGAAAQASGAGLFLVGGAVRDMLRGVEHLDLDLVVVGDLDRVLDELCAREGGEAVRYPRFGTATYRHPELRVDLARSRSERYPRPGARPLVEPLDDRLDLERRDFTVNAIALDLGPGSWGRPVDPHGGYPDLLAGCLRILHPVSFLDDPTRILRGIRYQVRTGFRMEAGTLVRLETAIAGACLRTLDPDRLLTELRSTLDLGAETEEAVRWIERYRLFESLDPGLALDPGDAVRVARTGRILAALEGSGVRVKDPGLLWAYLLLARTPSRLALARTLLPLPAHWVRKFEAAHMDPRPPRPGIRGRLGPAEAGMRLLDQDSGEDDFARGLSILAAEYGVEPERC